MGRECAGSLAARIGIHTGQVVGSEVGDELLRRAKRRAADEATTLRQVVEDALRSYLGGRSGRRRYEFRWRTEKGRILPGVRLDDRDALLDVMEGRR